LEGEKINHRHHARLGEKRKTLLILEKAPSGKKWEGKKKQSTDGKGGNLPASKDENADIVF